MALLFFGFWVVLNGRLTPEIAVFGAVISAGAYWFLCRFLDYAPRYDLVILRHLPWLGRYMLVLIREICLAALAMAGWIFNHRDIPEPVLVSFHPPLKTSFAQAVLANSISLTPGTITVSMVGGDFRVHCYDKRMADKIDDSVFVRLLMKLEGSL